MNIYLFLYLLFVIAPISTLIHESGHMIGAKIVKADHIKLSVGYGKEIYSFSSRNMQLTIHAFFFLGGQTESRRDNPYNTFEIAFITFFGPLFNIVFVFIFCFFYAIYFTEYVLLLILFNGWLATVNLIPFKIRGKTSDGYIILKALFKKK